MRKPWTPEEEQIVRALYPDTKCADVAARLNRTQSSVYQAARRLGLEKSEAFKASDASGRAARGRQHPNMIAARIKPGTPAWNKGLKGVVGVQEACRATQFKKGNIPHKTLPLGSYRVNKDGHLQQKVSEAKGSSSKRWRSVAELVWCTANGDVPEGYFVAFKRGQVTNKLELITLDRLECISRAENMRRNSFRTRSPELAGLYQLKGAINRQINRIAKTAESKNV